jgi:hypothetical protein
MARTLVGILVVAFSLATAGCLQNGAPSRADEPGAAGQDSHDHEARVPLANLELDFFGCAEGGGVSLYPTQEGSSGPVEPFQVANIQDDVGNPLIGSYGLPLLPGQASMGIWHISFQCERHTIDGVDHGPVQGGWVGMRILPPPWDESGIKRQYFVTDFSFSNWDLTSRFKADGVHASRTLDSAIHWLPASFIHQVFNDEEHGIFETHAKVRPYRDMETGPMRFWLLISLEADGHSHDATGHYRPISFDLANAAPEKAKPQHLVVDGTGWLSHTRTHNHDIGPVGVPGAAGNVGGLVWTGFDRTVRAGPAPDLVLEKTWIH